MQGSEVSRIERDSKVVTVTHFGLLSRPPATHRIAHAEKNCLEKISDLDFVSTTPHPRRQTGSGTGNCKGPWQGAGGRGQHTHISFF